MMASSQAKISTDGPTKLPGFGLPIDHMPEHTYRFPHAIADDYATQPITFRERRMLNFINQITDKPEWDRKVFDESIVSKWREEAEKKLDNDVILSEPMFDYCISELREKAKVFQESGFVHVLDVGVTVVKSDVAIATDIQEALRKHVKPLEDVPENQKDWHPDTNETVLDLVHPSLFPLVYGVSRVLPSGTVSLKECVAYTGKGEETQCNGDEPQNYRRPIAWTDYNLPAWGNYQWLPSDVHIDLDGNAKIVSYINNLHPVVHEELYGVLEQLVGCAVPLWNESLSWFHDRIRIKVLHTGNDDYYIPDGLKFQPLEVDSDYANSDASEPDSEPDYEFDDRYSDQYQDWWRANRILQQPEPSKFVPWVKRMQAAPHGACQIDLAKDFAASGLQIIFKLANIHLTPDNPAYHGGSWHIEGALNEHICATALYYYDEKNLTESSLAFRQKIDSEEMTMIPGQHEWDSMVEIFGTMHDESTVMELGSVVTREGRLLTFPNVLQHQVNPFKLADPFKPGHRKILAMFLVDPHIRILSTSKVPPQRADWWSQEVRKADQFVALPAEVFNNIVEGVNGVPMSWDDALDVRKKLMDERGLLAEELNSMFEEDHFSFCEH